MEAVELEAAEMVAGVTAGLQLGARGDAVENAGVTAGLQLGARVDAVENAGVTAEVSDLRGLQPLRVEAGVTVDSFEMDLRFGGVTAAGVTEARVTVTFQRGKPVGVER